MKKTILRSFVGAIVFCFTIVIFFYFVKAWNGLQSTPGDKLTSATWNNLANQINTLSGQVNALNGSPTWVTPTLQNSWAAYSSASYPVSYSKNGVGDVRLRGLLNAGTAGTTIFTLPAGYRPASTLMFVTLSYANNYYTRIDISPDGSVRHVRGNNSLAGLDGITFKAEQ